MFGKQRYVRKMASMRAKASQGSYIMLPAVSVQFYVCIVCSSWYTTAMAMIVLNDTARKCVLSDPSHFST